MSIFKDFSKGMTKKLFKEDTWFGTDPGFMTQEVVDPLKKAVATPLSQFLAGEVGKGLPRAEPLSPRTEENVQEFLKMSPGEWFDKAVGDPATKKFKEDLLPIIQEGYAGSLRGSGRFKAEEAGVSKLSEFLAVERTKAEREIPKEQFSMATALKQIHDTDWLRSLPHYNPAMDQAMQFLSEGTSSGTTVLSAVDQGEEGLISDILGMVGGIIGSKTGG